MRKIKKGDTVQVISGKHKTKIGAITKVIDDEFVVIDGVNVLKKAKKGSGIIEITHPLHISNVQYYDNDTKQRSKITIVDEKGVKKRKVVKTGKVLDK